MNEFAAAHERHQEETITTLRRQLAEARFEMQALEDENSRLRAAVLFIDANLDGLVRSFSEQEKQ